MDDFEGVVNLTQVGKVEENLHQYQFRSQILGGLTGIVLVYLLHFHSKNQPKEKGQKENKFTPALFVVYAIVTFLFTQALLVLLAIFSIYKWTVYVLLKIKHRSRFKGLLSGPDAFWLLKDDSSSDITILLIINSKENPHDTLLKHLTGTLCNYEKLFYTTNKCLGYSYLLQTDSDVSKHLSILPQKRYSSKEAIDETLSELASVNSSETLLWEILVGDEQIDWGGKAGNYPVFVRFNHCLGDGVALLQLLLSCFTDIVPGAEEDTEKDEFMQTLVKISIRCMHMALVLFNLPSLIFQRLSRKPDKNVIHGARLSGRKILAWKTEERGDKYVKVVKTIKKHLYGVGFFDVVATALAGSLNDFLRQHGDPAAELSAVVPAIPNTLQFADFNHIKTNYQLRNSFSVGILDLPIKDLNLKQYKVVERFQEVIRRVFALKKSLEYQVNYWLLNIVASVLPEQLLQPLLNSTQSTLVVSNLPGPRKLTVLRNSSLEDVVFWVPHRGLTGVGVSIFTYDNRFQVGISVDEVYCISRESIDKLLEDFFKHLERLQLQTSSC